MRYNNFDHSSNDGLIPKNTYKKSYNSGTDIIVIINTIITVYNVLYFNIESIPLSIYSIYLSLSLLSSFVRTNYRSFGKFWKIETKIARKLQG
jgi:hypothetical protein